MAQHLPILQERQSAAGTSAQPSQRWHFHLPQPFGRQWYCLLLGVTLVLAGCSSGTTRKTALTKSSKHVKPSAVELSSMNQSLLGLYSAEIEAAADKVRVESTSPVTRRQALVWKAEAIPVLQTSLLRTDPVAAALDAWAFILQMKTYMEQPGVKQAWGESYPTVTETLSRMETQMERLLQMAAPSANINNVRQTVASWAAAHPIEAGLAGRNSADADLLRRSAQSDLGAVASIKALGESLGDLTARLDAYNAYAPKQARWQAELLLTDLARDPQVAATASNLAELSHTLAKTSGSVERIPEVVGQAQRSILANLEGQRVAAQAFLREERLQTLNALDRARIATVADLRSERVAATADLRGERQIVLDAFRQEAAALTNDLNAAGEKALADFDARSRGLIDHFFVRALELALLMTVLCALATWIFLRRFMLRRRDRGETLYDRAA